MIIIPGLDIRIRSDPGRFKRVGSGNTFFLDGRIRIRFLNYVLNEKKLLGRNYTGSAFGFFPSVGFSFFFLDGQRDQINFSYDNFQT